MFRNARTSKCFKAISVCLLLAIALACRADIVSAQQADTLQQGTIWQGSIHQGEDVFPATISIMGRTGDRITGEIQFSVGDSAARVLTFQGNVVDAGTVTWITDRKAGNVTYPGLYIGKIAGNRITGVWQVPSAGQYDRFEVSRAP
jgi:hypothetical protein